jgi:predicted transcriptional regulator
MVKMSVVLSDEVATTLADMARRRGVSVSEVMRSAVGTELWRRGVESHGGRVLVEQESGRVRVVHFNVGRFWRIRRALGLKTA